MKELFELFITFFKIGLMTFGGGYAMLTILQKELAEKKKWATNEEIINYYAVGQCTPGIIAVNTATFIGYKKRKTLGGIIATLGIVLPSIIIIVLVALILKNIMQLPQVANAFSGIRIAVIVLVINAVIKLSKNAFIDIYTCIIGAVCVVICLFFGISPIYIIIAGCLGILLKRKDVKK